MAIAGDHARIGGESGVNGWKERAHVASQQPQNAPRRRGAGDLGGRFPRHRWEFHHMCPKKEADPPRSKLQLYN